MKKLNRMAVAVALCALTVSTASAQLRDGKPRAAKPDPAKMEVYKELFGTLKDWAKTNVVPQLRTWKSRLDGAMSAEDLATLNGLRARAAQLRKEAMATGMEMQKAWKSENYDALKASREKMKGYGEARKALFTELKPLAVKYATTLQAIGEEARPKVESWKEQGKEIAMQWIAKNKDRIGDGGFPHMRNMGKMMGIGGGMRAKAAAAYFMLWDGEDFLDHMQSIGGDGGGAPELN